MASLDSLPADQRAVLQLVLQRGRSYDDIAEMLSIDRAGVRDRALGALDALGPDADIDPARRALITDYLLGQLPRRVAEDVHERLATSPVERAWARVVASELAPLSTRPLPDIPTSAAAARSEDPEPVGFTRRIVPERRTDPAATVVEPDRRRTERRVGQPPPGRGRDRGGGDGGGVSAGERPSSRLGGAILLGAGLLVVIGVIVIVLATSGGSSHSSSSTATTSAGASTSSTASSSGTVSARPVAQIALTSPSGGRKVAGVAIVVQQGSQEGVVIRGQGLPANGAHDAYAVWLASGPGGSSRLLGFVNPPVKSDGALRTAGGLPSDASKFKQLLVTRETQRAPKTPGPVILQGALSLTG